jgi:hypothetical protein
MPVSFTAINCFVSTVITKLRNDLDRLFHNHPPSIVVIHLINSSQMEYKNGNIYISIKNA